MKKVPTGIKVISVYFILLIVLPFLMQGLVSGVKQTSEQMSQEQKIKAIQNPEYQKLNIKTVKDFDNYWAKKKSFSPLSTVHNKWIFGVSAIIVFVSLYGMWNLKNWGRLGIMTFTIFRICQEILTHNFFQSTPGHIFGDVVSLVIYSSIIFYLKRPEVKKLFESI